MREDRHKGVEEEETPTKARSEEAPNTEEIMPQEEEELWPRAMALDVKLACHNFKDPHTLTTNLNIRARATPSKDL